MRFFFDSYNGREILRDDEGRELHDIAAARLEAIEDAKELLTTAIFRGEGLDGHAMWVREGGDAAPVLIVGFIEVLNGLRS